MSDPPGVGFAIPAPSRATVPVLGCPAPFPVRRIYCAGRNYRDHVREMGGAPSAAPVFFAKPADAVVTEGRVPYPPATLCLHHEVELVVALGPGGVFGAAVGVDLTRRDLQREAKASGGPWDMAKGFDASAPISAIRPMRAPARGIIELSVGGVRRQRADLADMIFSVEALLEGLARLVRLRPGDLVFTGTPAGVGPLAIGDRVEARVEGVGALDFEITCTLAADTWPGGGA